MALNRRNGGEETATVYGIRRTLDGSARNFANPRISLARALAKLERPTVEGWLRRGRKSAPGISDGNWDTAGRRGPSFGDSASLNLLGAEHASRNPRIGKFY